MASALFAAADYAAALARLLPRGAVWSAPDPTSEQASVMAGLAPTAERLDAAAQTLLVDAFPATTEALLTEWEESLGLVAADQGLPSLERQAAITTQLVAVGGQSKADMIDYAAKLGVVISIGLYAPFRCGIATFGQALADQSWAFAWSITITFNSSGLSPAQILAALQAIAPAETLVFIAATAPPGAYTGPGGVSLSTEDGLELITESGFLISI